MLNLLKRNANRQPRRMSIEELESRLVPDASGLIQGLYQDVLHRSPGTGEMSYRNVARSTGCRSCASAKRTGAASCATCDGILL